MQPRQHVMVHLVPVVVVDIPVCVHVACPHAAQIHDHRKTQFFGQCWGRGQRVLETSQHAGRVVGTRQLRIDDDHARDLIAEPRDDGVELGQAFFLPRVALLLHVLEPRLIVVGRIRAVNDIETRLATVHQSLETRH